VGRKLKTNPKTRFIIENQEQIERAKKLYQEYGIGRAAVMMEVSYEAMREFGRRHELKTKFKQERKMPRWSDEEKDWITKEIEGMKFDDSEKNYRLLAKALCEKFGVERTPMAVKSQLGSLRLLVPPTVEQYHPFYSVEERDKAFEEEEQEKVSAGAEKTIKDYFDSLHTKIDQRCESYENQVNHFEELPISQTLKSRTG
jgi:hypothetical protein